MTFCYELEDDDSRLVDLFWLLGDDEQSEILKQASIKACIKLLYDDPNFGGLRDRAETYSEFVKGVLLRCRPYYPFVWDWPHPPADPSMEGVFLQLLDGRLLDFLLGSSADDTANAESLAISYNYNINELRRWADKPTMEEGETLEWISVTWIMQYFSDWRLDFVSLLEGSASQLDQVK